MTFDDAIELGNIQELQRLKNEGLLPDLMDTPDPVQPPRYPHETAIRWGQLDVLKWLVLESGQDVDLTAVRNRSLVEAIEFEHLDIVRWLILDSNQRIEIDLGPDPDWYSGNSEIAKFLNAVDRLIKSGFSLSLIRTCPEMIEDATLCLDVATAPRVKHLRRL